jgi:hypothetical protein
MLLAGRHQGSFSVTVRKGDKQRVFGIIARDTLKCYVRLGNIDDRVNDEPQMIEKDERVAPPPAQRKRISLGSGSMDYYMKKGARV